MIVDEVGDLSCIGNQVGNTFSFTNIFKHKVVAMCCVEYIKVHHLYRIFIPPAHVFLSFCVEYVPLIVSSVFMHVQVF